MLKFVDSYYLKRLVYTGSNVFQNHVFALKYNSQAFVKKASHFFGSGKPKLSFSEWKSSYQLFFASFSISHRCASLSWGDALPPHPQILAIHVPAHAIPAQIAVVQQEAQADITGRVQTTSQNHVGLASNAHH